MIRHYRRFSFVLSLAASGLMAGCSGSRDDLPREPVAGTVTLDGRPLAEGAIQFTPASGSGGPAISGTAAIENGQFSIPRADGLVPGSYKVSVSAVPVKREPRGQITIGKKKATQYKEAIPAKYNTKTILTEEIKRGGASDLKYDLQSK
ncbi:MAG TPA: carboxypeptidase-like regulatory domain-containing protein, partial [Isosphaeraceae bacterium]|nr:carboxypeptidase-like regulatory domain-containing protein [Isosphaeraceae bacterium]